jgi:hypothetical protein
MTEETALELYRKTVAMFPGKVRLTVEAIMPDGTLKTVDNEETAQAVLGDLAKVGRGGQ